MSHNVHAAISQQIAGNPNLRSLLKRPHNPPVLPMETSSDIVSAALEQSGLLGTGPVQGLGGAGAGSEASIGHRSSVGHQENQGTLGVPTVCASTQTEGGWPNLTGTPSGTLEEVTAQNQGLVQLGSYAAPHVCSWTTHHQIPGTVLAEVVMVTKYRIYDTYSSAVPCSGKAGLVPFVRQPFSVTEGPVLAKFDPRTPFGAWVHPNSG